MAEGDSILRLARRFEREFAGRKISARAPGARRPAGRPVAELDGRVLEGAESRGKHLLLRFSGDLVVHSHLGMRGAWHVYRRGERWRAPARAAWLALADGDNEAVNFNGTTMRIATPAELARDPRLRGLGPDILAEHYDLDEGAARLRASGTQVGDALLDQTVVAGIGNIFKSEGCFAARLDPWSEIEELSDEELRDVLERTRELMMAAVTSGRQPKRVYRRAGMPCPLCGERIRSRAQGDAARTTYWCPSCQGRPLAKGDAG